MMASTQKVDVLVHNHGSIVAFELRSHAAHQCVHENVQEDRQLFGGRLMVEPRYVDHLVAGMIGDGLEVR